MIKEHQGKMPDTYSELSRLPGIGEYTAGAIASIAFDEKVPAVDGNVMRVISRILESREDILNPKTKKEITQMLRSILPKEAGDFNQGIMELGEVICLPNGEPFCEECPLKDLCLAKEKGLTKEIPVRIVKVKRKKVDVTVFLFINQDEFAIQKRPAKGLLSNLYELPNEEKDLTEEQILDWMKQYQLQAVSIKKGKKRKHIFSHVEWNMQAYEIEVKEKNQFFTWIKPEMLQKEYAIPTAFLPFIKEYQEEKEKWKKPRK